ncbi:MAG: TRAP transporter small permease [Thiolinea sp.]
MSELPESSDNTQAGSLIQKVSEQGLRHLLGGAAAIVMFCMMLLTFIDVGGRYLFSMPVRGGFEITECLLVALIFLGLPLVTGERGHVDVDLLDSVTPQWLKRIQDKMVSLVNLLAFGVLSWLLWDFTLRTYEYQDTTSVLLIPHFILTALMAVCCTLSTLILLVMLLSGRQRMFAPDNEYSA